MARKNTSATPDPPPSDGLDQLTSTVDTLAQEVRVLREAVDELRELLEWAMQNREGAAGYHPFRPVSTLPGDGIDMEGGDEINHPKPDRHPDEDEEDSRAAVPGELF